MRRLVILFLPALLASCSYHSQLKSALPKIQAWKSAAEAASETSDLTDDGRRAEGESPYDEKPVVESSGNASCAALLSTMHNAAPTCGQEIDAAERVGGQCVAGENGQPSKNCPKCEEMLSAKQQWEEGNCDPTKARA